MSSMQAAAFNTETGLRDEKLSETFSEIEIIPDSKDNSRPVIKTSEPIQTKNQITEQDSHILIQDTSRCANHPHLT